MKWVKNIIVWILAIVGLSVSGIFTIDMKVETETKQSSYKLTDFDYVITSPSKEQVTEFRANTDVVSSIFPCYLFETTLTGSNNSKVTLLLSDQMDYYDIGLFNNDTKESGEYSVNNICLDRTAANNLGVDVGGKVSVSLAYQTFEFTVGSIYMASTYKNMDSGLALAQFSSEISAAYGKELTYNIAFVDAKDTAKCAEMLNGYVPLGNLQSEADYTAEYKSNNNCPPSMTEDEWNASIKTAYEEYKAQYMSQTFTGVVQDKAEYMKDVQDQISTTVTKINYVCVGIAVGVVVLYTLLSIVFVYSSKKDDRIDIKVGKTNVGNAHILMSVLGAVIVAAGTGLVLTIYGAASQFLNTFGAVIASFSLPVLITIPVLIPIIKKYEKGLKEEVK